ncbi:MAG: erythromycin esterase family protein [Ferruginibacter sp.]
MHFFYPSTITRVIARYLPTLFLAVSLAGGAARAQDIEAYVKQNTVSIKTISPDSSDYADLETFGNAIGDARIVMLGEQDHGDAPAFLAKTRLIRYLHEKKGFNVLAFESDFFGLNQGWDQADKSNIQFFFQGNIFPVWTFCSACNYLFKQYIPQTQTTATPIQVSGFDMQLVLQFSNTFLTKKLDSLLQSHNLPITREPDYATKILPLVDSCKRTKLSRESMYDEQHNYLLRIRDELGSILSPTDFWLILVDNLLAENMQHRPANNIHAVINYRDEQMAKNLLWLATVKYSKEKIIVWAQNGHISRYGQFNDSWQNEMHYMGRVFDEIKPASLKTYSLGFTSFEGEAGRVSGGNIFKVDKPRKNAYENWVPPSFDYAFTDFTAFRITNPSAKVEFRLKGFGHNYLQNGSEWHKIFDGLFFIRRMYSCIKKNP